ARAVVTPPPDRPGAGAEAPRPRVRVRAGGAWETARARGAECPAAGCGSFRGQPAIPAGHPGYPSGVMADATAPSIRIGTSGWAYSSWRGVFYPPEVARGAGLSFFSGALDSVELQGSFDSLQHPSPHQGRYGQTPPGFVFSVKGSRFITHRKQLREVRTALANFLASGVLALREKLGPVLWQLPPRMEFDAERLVEFFRLLPRTTGEAAELARQHDERLTGRTHLQVEADRPLRHALEPRHPSFATAAAVELLREHDIGLVVSDSGGKWPYFEDVTSD